MDIKEKIIKAVNEIDSLAMDINENGKYVEQDRVVLNTTHYSVQVVETPEGVVIDVFHRHGDLINTYTYWNDDVMEEN